MAMIVQDQAVKNRGNFDNVIRVIPVSRMLAIALISGFRVLCWCAPTG